MNRRNFIALGGLVGTAAAALPAVSYATSMRAANKMPDLVFTAEDPAHWVGVKKLHVPKTEVMGGMLKISTPHPMSEGHYIVSHTVVLDGGRFLSRQTFTPKDKPVSEHKLPMGYKGKVFITSTCNQHDFWLKEIHV